MTIKELKMLRNRLEEIDLPERWISITEELLKPENLVLSVTALERKLKTSRYTINQIMDFLKTYLKQNP